MTETNEVAFYSLRQAAKYGKVSRQAIYSAIRKNRLKAEKVGSKWKILKRDYDEYRLNRHNRELRIYDGEKVFDEELGHYSVMFISKALSSALGRSYHPQHIYYLIRMGQLRAFKKGSSWVIRGDDAQALFEKEYAVQNIISRYA